MKCRCQVAHFTGSRERGTASHVTFGNRTGDVAKDRLDEMGDKYGSVFMMRFLDGYSESEIAKKLKLNVGTVKTRAYRARTAVRSELETALAS